MGLAVLFAAACGADPEHPFHQPPAAAVFSPDVRHVVLEVDYAEGAEPYTGSAGALTNLWSITSENLAALFAGAPKDITVPSTLDVMQRIEAPDGPYGSSDVLELAQKYRNVTSSGDTISFYVVFLNGVYSDKGVVDDTVLGAALAGTGVIAIFKPVIAAADRAFEPNSTRFTEQATLVHELGHSVGLVNVGLPMAQSHEDANHPSHCDNSRCVMYWANEAAAGLGDFLFGTVEAGNEVLFDAFCLADAKAAARRYDAGDGAATDGAVTDVFVSRDR
jgi:predicted Zn-dependent protease